MKTLINIFIILSLSSFLMAQIDSTATEAPVEEAVESPVEEVVEEVVETADSTESAPEEMIVADSTEMDTTSLEMTTLDSTATDSSMVVAEDTVVVPEPEMEWVQNDPAPTALAGLISKGALYYWSNDALEKLNFEAFPYISIIDPTMIAIKANDCLDIVCHLLASDSSGVSYVVVTKNDGSNVRIYNTETKVVAIEAPADSIAMALDTYLKELAGMEYLALAIEDTIMVEPTLTVDADELSRIAAKMKTLKIRNRQFRSLDDISSNPANLARSFGNLVSLNLLPDFKISIHNSLLTPGWYSDWWTAGGVWDAAMKADYLSTIMDKDLALNIAPDRSGPHTLDSIS